MRKSNTLPIGEILKDYIKAMMIGPKLKEFSLIKSWDELLGEMVRTRTKQIFVKNRTLYVRLTSPTLRQELFMMRQAIVEKLNEKAGEQVIDKLVFL